MKTRVLSAVLLLALVALAWPSTTVVRELTPREAMLARGSQTVTLDHHKCEFVDTHAACDIENQVDGPCTAFNEPCGTCDLHPSATNESWFCLRTIEVTCTKKSTGTMNVCGDRLEGTCAFDDQFNLYCDAQPNGVCADILVDGCNHP